MGDIITPEQTTRHESGLEFLQPSPHYRGLSSGFSQRCFGQLLDDPQFTTLGQMHDMADTLDSVTLRKVWYSNVKAEGDYLGREIEQIEDEGHRATVSSRSRKVYAYVSQDYTPVNDADAFNPLMEVAQERGLKPVGRFDGMGTGMTRGHVIFTNPEFKVRLLEDYDDDIMLGVRMSNSYDTSAAVSMDVFGVRMVCINYNLWGRMLGYIHQPHVNFNPEHLARGTKRFLEDVVKRSPVLSQVAQRAFEVPVVTVEIPDLLWAVDMPIRGIEKIASAPSVYNPEIETRGLNMWTLYNGVTAYLTWGREKGAHYLEATMDYAKAATELLNAEHDTLIEKGKAAREKYEERLERREAQKQTLKVVRYDGGTTDF